MLLAASLLGAATGAADPRGNEGTLAGHAVLLDAGGRLLSWVEPQEPTNLNQYAAGEMARYVLEDPGRDPDWRAHAGRALSWIERTFGADAGRERGQQWGATVISEQVEYTFEMGSHTARFASVQALWHERTGEPMAGRRPSARSTGRATCATGAGW